MLQIIPKYAHFLAKAKKSTEIATKICIYVKKNVTLQAKLYFMLKRVIIKNFFSFAGETTIELKDGVNLLLGINGSGKTSFIRALKLLYEGVAGEGFEPQINAWGGYSSIVNANGDNKPECISLTYVFDYIKVKEIIPNSPFANDIVYKITLFPYGSTSYSISESLYVVNNKKFSYISFRNGKGYISMRTEEGEIVKKDTFTETDISSKELVLRQISNPQRYQPSHTIRKCIENLSIYSTFDLRPLRRPTDYNQGERLIASGHNLSYLLNNLKNQHSIEFDKIEELMKDVNPNYKSIDFSLLGSQIYLSIREKNIKHAIDALHMSDGTLRFLLLLSIFCNPNRGYIIGIDEPESGLHPDMIKSVAKMIKQAAKDTQIIIATHSPLLLNQFTLDDILVFDKDKDNHTVVSTPTETDFEDWEGAYLPGQMWLYGVLGGKRW